VSRNGNVILPPFMPELQTDVGTTARNRVAWRLLPFLFLLYVANYLDRTNIAFAPTMKSMRADLHLNDSVFGTASGIFFIGYFALQIPGALLVERWSARKLLALTLISWGALTTLTGFVRTSTELYTARFLLGVAEAGFFPGVIVYLSHWFIYPDRAKAVSRFMSAIPIGFIVGGPLAGTILQMQWLNIAGWRWLFLLEGVPAIVFGLATLFFLPNRPNEVRWLRPDEKDWLTARLAEERQAKAHVEHMSVWQALRHPAVLILTAGLFFTYTGGYAFWLWCPQILQRLTGWGIQEVGWVSAIPFAAGLFGMLLLGWSSDRLAERRWHFAMPQLTAAVALVAWLVLPHSNELLLVVFAFVGFGTVAYLASFWALPSAFLTSSAAAAAVGFINCTASIGGFFGPKIIGEISQRTGAFTGGFAVMIGCFVIASVLVLVCPREKVDTARGP
jgi:sugar phosphate permease